MHYNNKFVIYLQLLHLASAQLGGLELVVHGVGQRGESHVARGVGRKGAHLVMGIGHGRAQSSLPGGSVSLDQRTSAPTVSKIAQHILDAARGLEAQLPVFRGGIWADVL